MTDKTANASDRPVVRIVIGVLIAMFAICGVTHIQPSDDAATLAGRAFVGILIAVLSIYLMASGIKRVTSSACGFSNSDTVDQVHADSALTQLKSSEQDHFVKP